jgi:hypothetical protein
MEGCDPKHCSQCNPKVAKAELIALDVENAIKNSLCIPKLEKLLANNDIFCVKGYRFNIRRYIRSGYKVEDDQDYHITITFIHDYTFCGVLHDQFGNKKIYHNGTLDLDNVYPQYCKHIFLIKNKNGNKGPDVDAIHHIKILFCDTIFEEYVHSGDGVIIDESELDEALLATDKESQ